MNTCGDNFQEKEDKAMVFLKDLRDLCVKHNIDLDAQGDGQTVIRLMHESDKGTDCLGYIQNVWQQDSNDKLLELFNVSRKTGLDSPQKELSPEEITEKAASLSKNIKEALGGWTSVADQLKNAEIATIKRLEAEFEAERRSREDRALIAENIKEAQDTRSERLRDAPF